MNPAWEHQPSQSPTDTKGNRDLGVSTNSTAVPVGKLRHGWAEGLQQQNSGAPALGLSCLLSSLNQENLLGRHRELCSESI